MPCRAGLLDHIGRRSALRQRSGTRCRTARLVVSHDSLVRSAERLTSPESVAIATELSGLLVVDVDVEHRVHSRRSNPPSWQQLLARLATITGDTPSLRTFTVRTPSGGLHLYHRTPPGPHIDTRGNGGYVVATGSVLTTGLYRLLDDRPPIQLHDWLTIALARNPQPVSPSRRDATSVRVCRRRRSTIMPPASERQRLAHGIIPSAGSKQPRPTYRPRHTHPPRRLHCGAVARATLPLSPAHVAPSKSST
ncbi:bifunctional DNA primase/polymerase [Nocardia brasiliensis]|uniref:bifunctional DNA primase/polymerase n=1 Tax=Nocardia brasiliensis TaxID=37326 RepID=UPI003CC7D573